jgi:hypothetical protein
VKLMKQIQTMRSEKRGASIQFVIQLYLGGGRCCARHNSYFAFFFLFFRITVSALLTEGSRIMSDLHTRIITLCLGFRAHQTVDLGGSRAPSSPCSDRDSNHSESFTPPPQPSPSPHLGPQSQKKLPSFSKRCDIANSS